MSQFREMKTCKVSVTNLPQLTCNVCEEQMDELSGFCSCTKYVKYVITCDDCGCEFEDFDFENNPETTVKYTSGQCSECWEWEVENLK